jgi:hypothetical protein
MNKQKTDVYKAKEIIEKSAGAVPSEDQVRILDDSYNIYKDVIDAAVQATKSLKESPEGAAKLAALKKYLKGEDSSIDGEGLVLELVNSPEFAEVIEAAKLKGKFPGIKAIKGLGLGVAYHGSWLKKGGKEKGIEGIIIFPQTVGNTTTPTQAATRKWDYKTRQIKHDLGGVVGINLSLWFCTPFSSKLLVGLMGEIAVLLGGSLAATGALPTGTDSTGINNLTETINNNLPPVVNTLSIGIDLGLAVGKAIITGEQDVSIKGSMTTLSVINTATNTPDMVVSQSAELKVTLSYPYMGKEPLVILNNNNTTTTNLTIGMPAFLSDSVETATVEPPAGWEKTGASNGAFQFAYTGPDNQAWNTKLEFTISNIVSNSGLSGSQYGLVTASMTGTTSSRSFKIPVKSIPASLQLNNLQFTAALDWKVVTNADFTIQGQTSGNGDVVTPPMSFQPLPPGSESPTIITDPSGIEWLVGYKFQIDSNNQPNMQAVWQQKGCMPLANKYTFASGLYSLKSPQEITLNYKNLNGSPTLLTIDATLESD